MNRAFITIWIVLGLMIPPVYAQEETDTPEPKVWLKEEKDRELRQIRGQKEDVQSGYESEKYRHNRREWIEKRKQEQDQKDSRYKSRTNLKKDRIDYQTPESKKKSKLQAIRESRKEYYKKKQEAHKNKTDRRKAQKKSITNVKKSRKNFLNKAGNSGLGNSKSSPFKDRRNKNRRGR